jgi:hypothetical protein
MSYGWVKQLYLSGSCLLNPRITDKHGDRTMVELCDRRPGRCVRNSRRTEDPSKTEERNRRSECPTQGSWAADSGNSSTFHDECWVCEWCSILRLRAVSNFGVDPEYGDNMLFRNLVTHVQDYTESQPRKPQYKNNLHDTTLHCTRHLKCAP